MESSKGYCGRFVLPKIDLGAGRAEYLGALPNVLASFGIAAVSGKGDKTANGVDDPKPKGNGKRGKGRGGRAEGITFMAGVLDAPRLYPSGKRLLKPERSLAMAHARRVGQDVFFGGWNLRGIAVASKIANANTTR